MEHTVLSLFHLAAGACGGNTGVLPSLYDGLCTSAGNVQITSVSDVLIILANALRILLILGGSLAVAAIMVAGIFYAASTGDAKRVSQAKNIILNVVIGLILDIGAYAIVTFIAGAF